MSGPATVSGSDKARRNIPFRDRPVETASRETIEAIQLEGLSARWITPFVITSYSIHYTKLYDKFLRCMIALVARMGYCTLRHGSSQEPR